MCIVREKIFIQVARSRPFEPRPEVPALEMAGGFKDYSSRVRALDGLELRVEPGEIFGLIGPNGAGKSTAIRIAATLLKPSSGEVRVWGRDVVGEQAEVRRVISYLPEEAGTYENLTGEEYLRFMARFHAGDVESAVKRGARIADLGERIKSRTKEYSRGMKRRLLGISPTPLGMALLASTLLLSFVSALSLAVLLATFTKDVRSAQSLMAVVYIPIMVPAVVLMFSPVSSLPLAVQAAVLAIPFSYPIIASQALYTHQYLTVALGLVYQALFTMGVLALAARIFSTEKILTARLELGRMGRAPAEKL